MILNRFPLDLKEKWIFFLIERKFSQTNKVQLSEWRIDVALVHNQLLPKRSHEPRGEAERWKLNPIHQTKTRTYVTEDNSQNSKNKGTDHCLCCNKGIHKLWNCPVFKTINVKQRYDVVKSHKLCFGCLGKAHSIKKCKVNPCGIDGCDLKQNQLLHENRSERRPKHQESNNSFSMLSNSGLLSIIRVLLSNSRTDKSMQTCASQDIGSTVTLIDKSLEAHGRSNSEGTHQESQT